LRKNQREVLENKNCVSQIKLQFKATAIDKIKKNKEARCQWLRHVILAIEEAEIGGFWF
jgi:hypothetical protein